MIGARKEPVSGDRGGIPLDGKGVPLCSSVRGLRSFPVDSRAGWSAGPDEEEGGVRRITLVLLVAAVGLVPACGDDDGDAEDSGAPSTDATGGAGESTSSTSGAGETGDDAGTMDCPAATRLHAVTEASAGDVEILADGTAFPSAHFTLDLDGSGFGPVLSGVFSTDADEDVASMTHTPLDPAPADVRRVAVLLEGPSEGETVFPLGVYDVTFSDGKVAPTESTGLSQLDVQEGSSAAQARNFSELELTHVGDDVICGELRPVDRSDDTSQAPTWLEGEFVATYSEQP